MYAHAERRWAPLTSTRAHCRPQAVRHATHLEDLYGDLESDEGGGRGRTSHGGRACTNQQTSRRDHLPTQISSLTAAEDDDVFGVSAAPLDRQHAPYLVQDQRAHNPD
jgi:hypothetical protein